MTGRDTQTTPHVAATADELVAGATRRTPVNPSDGKSGSIFERVEIDGESYFLKTLSYSTDWIMRVTGDRDYRTVKIWQAGVMAAAPSCIDHTVVGIALEGDGPEARMSILMRDVGDELIPEGDTVIPTDVHLAFMDHLAALSAHFWGWEDDIGLTSIEERIRFFAPDNIAPELLVAHPPGAIAAANEGWGRLPERSPELDALARSMHADPTRLADAIRTTPMTFLHGDWKMGNLGHHADGRTILLDWAYPGAGPACWDLLWYLALNRARLSISKEESIAAFRAALERHGVDTAGWWDRQLALCTVAIMATFAWEKALGDADELAWWEARALEGAHLVDQD